jgi:agmatine deiminase
MRAAFGGLPKMSFVVPPEWAPHKAMWLGFPSHAELWQEDLEEAQAEVAALARALAGPGGERVRVMTGHPGGEAAARELLGDVPGVELVLGRFGDIWLRDTGPIFADGKALAFRFNGWGGKYSLQYDDTVAHQIAETTGVPLVTHEFILEGGAVDHDGAGTVLTTDQCLLNKNRNPGWTAADAEDALAHSLGARKVLWLGEGLRNDHTDGHVDNLARFVAPATVTIPVAWGRGDPIPASHMNFLIANKAVIVPIYAKQPGEFAVEVLKQVFPDRAVIGLPSIAILTGGGSFHCITQQEPA